MNTENDKGQLVTDYGQILREKHIDVPELLQRLEAMEGSQAARDAAKVIQRFKRLLLPVYMGISENAMVGEPVPDEARIFNFMGSGGSDFTFMAEFRSLMGDERTALEEYEKEAARAANGECTVLSGCQKMEEHTAATCPHYREDDTNNDPIPEG